MSEILQADLLAAQQKVTVLTAELEQQKKLNQMLSAHATYFFTIVQALDFHQGYLAEMQKRLRMITDEDVNNPERIWHLINTILDDFQEKRQAVLKHMQEAKGKAEHFAMTVSMPQIIPVEPGMDLSGVRAKEDEPQ